MPKAKKIDEYINIVPNNNGAISGKVLPMTRQAFDRLGTVIYRGKRYPSGGYVLKSAYDAQNGTPTPPVSEEAKAIIEDKPENVATEANNTESTPAPKRRSRKKKVVEDTAK